MSNTTILDIGHCVLPVYARICQSNVSGQIFLTIKIANGIVVDKIYKDDQAELAKKEGSDLHTFWCGVANEVFNQGYNTGLNENR